MTSPAQSPESLAPAPVAERPAPVAERIVALDCLRGIAVLGILTANIVAYGYPLLAYYWPPALADGGTAADGWAWLAQLVLVDSKFRALFTLLFGAGMALFLDRARARGAGEWLQARRLLWLAVFGLTHFYLLFTGDILFLYAVAGLAALPLAGMAAPALLRTGTIWFCAAALLTVPLMTGQALLEADPAAQAAQPEAHAQLQEQTASALASAAEESEVMRHASYAGIVAWRWQEETRGLAVDVIYLALLETIPLILIGMALYRYGLFEGRLGRRATIRWGWAGWLGGAALTLAAGLWVVAGGFPYHRTVLVFTALAPVLALPMAIGLAALLALWAPAASGTWIGARVTAAGRVAFSNYIGSSVLMMLVFQGWAGGLYGSLDRIGMLPLVLLGWAAMLAWPVPWLARFRYGPLEWLWRCLTYGQWVPFRR